MLAFLILSVYWFHPLLWVSYVLLCQDLEMACDESVIGVRGLFVTHIHDLPMKVAEFNAHPDNRGKIDNLAAQMLDRENGTRSYKIVRMTPDGLSYAKDIAEKYGLRLDAIIEGKKRGRR